MGIETTKALQARRREAAARVERLIAAADERSPIGSARRARIKSAVREGRRELRSLEAAEQAVEEVKARVGDALTRLIDDGLTGAEAYECLGLSRAVSRRLIEVAARRRTPADFSTAHTTGPVPSASPGDGESGAHLLGGATNEGNL